MNLCTLSNWTPVAFSTFITLVSLHLIQAEILWKSYIFIIYYYYLPIFHLFLSLWTRMCVLLQTIGHSNTDTILYRNKQKAYLSLTRRTHECVKLRIVHHWYLDRVSCPSLNNSQCFGDWVWLRLHGERKACRGGPVWNGLNHNFIKVCVTAFFPWRRRRRRRRRIYSPKRNGFSSLRQRTAFQVSLSVC